VRQRLRRPERAPAPPARGRAVAVGPERRGGAGAPVTRPEGAPETAAGAALLGETSAAEAARKHGLTVAQVEEWREPFLAGGENGLRSRPRAEERLKDDQITQLVAVARDKPMAAVRRAACAARKES